MMKPRFAGALFGLILLSFLGCQKDLSYERPANGNNNGGQAYFRANVDGVQWQALDSETFVTILYGTITIIGTDSNGNAINIFLASAATGTYSLDSGSLSNAEYSEYNSGNSILFSTNQSKNTSLAGGSVVVTEIDTVNKTISGTFQFNGYNMGTGSKKGITEGVFNKLPYANMLPPASSTDTFTATINGAAWVAKSISNAVTTIDTSSTLQLIIQGSQLDGTQLLALFIPMNVGPGTYPLDFSGGFYYGAYSPDLTTFMVSQNNGTVTILENNSTTRRIRANFSFIATSLIGNQSAQITNGYFSVGY